MVYHAQEKEQAEHEADRILDMYAPPMNRTPVVDITDSEEDDEEETHHAESGMETHHDESEMETGDTQQFRDLQVKRGVANATTLLHAQGHVPHTAELSGWDISEPCKASLRGSTERKAVHVRSSSARTEARFPADEGSVGSPSASLPSERHAPNVSISSASAKRERPASEGRVQSTSFDFGPREGPIRHQGQASLRRAGSVGALRFMDDFAAQMRMHHGVSVKALGKRLEEEEQRVPFNLRMMQSAGVERAHRHDRGLESESHSPSRQQQDERRNGSQRPSDIDEPQIPASAVVLRTGTPHVPAQPIQELLCRAQSARAILTRNADVLVHADTMHRSMHRSDSAVITLGVASMHVGPLRGGLRRESSADRHLLRLRSETETTDRANEAVQEHGNPALVLRRTTSTIALGIREGHSNSLRERGTAAGRPPTASVIRRSSTELSFATAIANQDTPSLTRPSTAYSTLSAATTLADSSFAYASSRPNSSSQKLKSGDLGSRPPSSRSSCSRPEDWSSLPRPPSRESISSDADFPSIFPSRAFIGCEDSLASRPTSRDSIRADESNSLNFWRLDNDQGSSRPHSGSSESESGGRNVCFHSNDFLGNGALPNSQPMSAARRNSASSDRAFFWPSNGLSNMSFPDSRPASAAISNAWSSDKIQLRPASALKNVSFMDSLSASTAVRTSLTSEKAQASPAGTLAYFYESDQDTCCPSVSPRRRFAFLFGEKLFFSCSVKKKYML